MIRYVTAGESHGPGVVAIAEGFPAGLVVTREAIDRELARRRFSVGRGGRGAIEPDTVEILSGVRYGRTLGTPIALLIRNSDWPNWTEVMNPDPQQAEAAPITRPRPGHADLAGALKFGHTDLRNVLERASARETAARVAVGALAKALLHELGTSVLSHVVRIGAVAAEEQQLPDPERLRGLEGSPTRCLDPASGEAMERVVDKAAEEGETLGGTFEVIAYGVLPGLGSYAQWDTRLDGRLAGAMMSIPAIKGVEIGLGFGLAGLKGTEAADEIYFRDGRYERSANRMGGVEGGISTGQPVVVRAVMKPLPTVRKGLHTVDLATKEEAVPIYERTDVCAVPRAAVVAEACVAIVLATAAREKFGGDSVEEFRRSARAYTESIRDR